MKKQKCEMGDIVVGKYARQDYSNPSLGIIVYCSDSFSSFSKVFWFRSERIWDHYDYELEKIT